MQWESDESFPRMVGTGTFVSDTRTIVTAAHIIRSAPPGSLFGVPVHGNGVLAESVYLHREKDLAVIKLRKHVAHGSCFAVYDKFDSRTRDLGKDVQAHGYHVVEQRWYDDWIMKGHIQAREPDGCYVLSFPLKEGHSGGPVVPLPGVWGPGRRLCVMGILVGTSVSQTVVMEEECAGETRRSAMFYSKAESLEGLEDWIANPSGHKDTVLPSNG